MRPKLEVAAPGRSEIAAPGLSRRGAGSLALGALCAMAAGGTARANYPDKPIRWLVPYGAGTSSDLTIRIITPKMADLLGQQVVVENRPGAGGNIAADLAARAKPDGYTIFLGSTASHGANPALMKDLPYDPFKSFTPISGLVTYGFVLVVSGTSPVKTVKDLIEAAKSSPKPLNYASSGTGASSHLIAAALANEAGLKMTHIPYNTGAQAYNELINGSTALMFYPYNALESFIKSGQLRPVAVTGAKREPFLPDTPTMVESGMPDFVWASWMAIHAPAGTPPEVQDRLSKAVHAALADPDVAQKLKTSGVQPMPLSPAELDAFARSENARYAKLIGQIGLAAK